MLLFLFLFNKTKVATEGNEFDVIYSLTRRGGSDDSPSRGVPTNPLEDPRGQGVPATRPGLNTRRRRRRCLNRDRRRRTPSSTRLRERDYRGSKSVGVPSTTPKEKRQDLLCRNTVGAADPSGRRHYLSGSQSLRIVERVLSQVTSHRHFETRCVLKSLDPRNLHHRDGTESGNLGKPVSDMSGLLLSPSYLLRHPPK